MAERQYTITLKVVVLVSGALEEITDFTGQNVVGFRTQDGAKEYRPVLAFEEQTPPPDGEEHDEPQYLDLSGQAELESVGISIVDYVDTEVYPED